MNKLLKTAIEHDANLKVSRIKKFSSGSMNLVFKVETNRGAVVARVFAKKDFPNLKKLIWIDNALKKAGIPTAKVLFSTKKSKPFRFGYMLTEFVEGKDGWRSMKDGAISLPNYFKKFGSLMKKVHSIKLTKNSQLKAALPKNNYNWFKNILSRFSQKSSLAQTDLIKIENFVIGTLTRYSRRCKNVLCHCDPGPQNHVYTKNGSIVLIDWDLAEIDTFFRDLSPLTINHKMMCLFGKPDDVANLIQKSFLKSYGKTGFTPVEIEIVTDAYHIISHIYNALTFPPNKADKNRYKGVGEKILKIVNKHSE